MAAQSPARAGHSPASIPTLLEVTSSVCVITHSLEAGSESVCPVPTQWAFQNSQINDEMGTGHEVDVG